MKNKGFTFLEILFALSIIAIAITIVSFSFSKLNSQQTLDKSATLVVSVLDEARSLTLSSVGDSQYGVFLEASQLTLFKGSSYSSSDPSNVITELNTLVELKNINLAGGGASIVFKRLTGYTDEAGSLEIFLKNSPETLRTINISSTGVSSIDS